LQHEWDRCQSGAVCRRWVNLIGAEPPAIEFAANNGRRDCVAHAEEAKRRLGGHGDVVNFCAYDRTSGKVEGHAVLLVDDIVIDNGALNGFRVFPARDLNHYVRECP
jgi:hypothetical protein